MILMVAAVATMVVGQAGLSYYSADQSRKATARYRKSVANAEAKRRAVMARQAQRVAQVKREQNIDEARKMYSSINAAKGDWLGVGSASSIQRQILMDAEENEQTINQNMLAEIEAGALAKTQFQDDTTNPILAAVAGGLSGLGTGLMLGGMAEKAFGSNQATITGSTEGSGQGVDAVTQAGVDANAAGGA